MPLFSKGSRVMIIENLARPWMKDVVGFTGVLDDDAKPPGCTSADVKKYFWFRPDRSHNYRLSVFVVREDEVEIVVPKMGR